MLEQHLLDLERAASGALTASVTCGIGALKAALASTPAEPRNTEALVWSYLGQAELKNRNFDAAVTALNNYLDQTATGGGRANALVKACQEPNPKLQCDRARVKAAMGRLGAERPETTSEALG